MAYVEHVNSDGSFVISEMNVSGEYSMNWRVLKRIRRILYAPKLKRKEPIRTMYNMEKLSRYKKIAFIGGSLLLIVLIFLISVGQRKQVNTNEKQVKVEKKRN